MFETDRGGRVIEAIWSESNFDGREPLARVSGRVCLNCDTVLNSYAVERRYCSSCEPKVFDAEMDVVSLWEYARDKIEQEPNRAEKAKVYEDFIEAATERLASEHSGGYPGELEEIAFRLSDILPLPDPLNTRKVFRRTLKRGEKRGVFERASDKLGRAIYRINDRVAATFLAPLFGVGVAGGPVKTLATIATPILISVGVTVTDQFGPGPTEAVQSLYDDGLIAVHSLTVTVPQDAGIVPRTDT